MRYAIRKNDWSGAARLSAAIVGIALLTGCAETMGGGIEGGAGCAAYQEARLALPSVETLATVPTQWAIFIADLDDRMTGVCTDG